MTNLLAERLPAGRIREAQTVHLPVREIVDLSRDSAIYKRQIAQLIVRNLPDELVTAVQKRAGKTHAKC